jgi:hypothetical protein
MRTDIPICYDRATSNRANCSTGDVLTTNTPAVFKNNDYLFTITLYDDYPTASNVASIVDWVVGLGKLSSTPYVEVLNADFNIDAGADPTNGIITFRMNTTSATLDTDLGTSSQKTYYMEVKGDDGTSEGTIYLTQIIVKNTIY